METQDTNKTTRKQKRVQPEVVCKVCKESKAWEVSGAHMCNACFDSRLRNP